MTMAKRPISYLRVITYTIIAIGCALFWGWMASLIS